MKIDINSYRANGKGLQYIKECKARWLKLKDKLKWIFNPFDVEVKLKWTYYTRFYVCKNNATPSHLQNAIDAQINAMARPKKKK